MKLIPILFFISFPVFAQTETWLISGTAYQFKIISPQGYLISVGCADEKSVCEAKNKLKNHIKKVDITEGGKHPGSVICKNLGGRVLLARKTDQSTQSFCRFKDNSLASLDAF